MNEKNIIRTNKRESEKPFVMIERSIFENTELSWRAKGLLGYLLSRPDDWSVCVADLINRSTDGRDSCYAALKELGDAGYIAKSARPKLAGRFGGFEYVVFEKPVSVSRDVSPVGKTAYGLPVSGETVSGETDTTYKDYTNKDCTNNKTAPIVAETPKPKAPKIDPLAIDLPPNIKPELWAEFVAMRRDTKKPVTTQSAIKGLLNQLAKCADANASLQQSIDHCWQGVFEVKPSFNQPAFKPAFGQVATRAEPVAPQMPSAQPAPKTKTTNAKADAAAFLASMGK